MNEDERLKQIVRAALEEGVGVRPERLAALEQLAQQEATARQWRRRWFRGGASVLLAASVALVFALRVPLGGETAVGAVEVIGLLRAMDGHPVAADEASSPAEILLAWQEAPLQ